MLRRILRWILVAMTAVLIAHMILRAAGPVRAAQSVPTHSERIAATPWAPACQASSRSAGPSPPMA